VAQKAVSDSTIRAPFSGFISERKVSAGEYITPSTPVVTLVRTNPIKINLQIPEAETAKVKIGMSVSITVSAYTDRSFAGRVTAIKPALETVSRAVVVEAQIDNAENLLRPNMFATGRLLQPGGENGIFVPKSAVIEDRNTNSRRVFTIVDGAARLVVIQVGEEEGDAVRVTSGLDGTETVAITNVNQLFDSVPVRVAQ
jgi:RND family efflux transporter MFP subunit